MEPESLWFNGSSQKLEKLRTMGAVLRKSITKTIGKEKHVFQVEVNSCDLYEVVTESQNLSFPDVPFCGLCGSDDLRLGSHLAQNKHKYVTVTCNKCRGYVNFGKQQENPNIYFLRLKKDDKGNTMKGPDNKPLFDWKKFSQEEKG